MAEVKKARLFLRRGTDADRIKTILCEGELGYSTDAFRVVVGDGTTAGGKALGATVFVSAGSLARHFHTKLTTASGGGVAHTGDLAVFPALTYFKADGVTTSTTSNASATCVMLLTGTDPSVTTSWVSINSGIPWGNLQVQADDITGDYISGGDISGDVSFSGTVNTIYAGISGNATYGTGLVLGSLAGSNGNRNVFVTSSGILTAEGNVGDGKTADGTLQFLASPVTITNNETGSACNWLNYPNPAGVPSNATGGLFQFVWKRGASVNPDIQALYLRSGSASYALSAAVTQQSDTNQKGSLQLFCPLSGGSGNNTLGFDFKMDDGAGGFSTPIFKQGYHLSLIGYM